MNNMDYMGKPKKDIGMIIAIIFASSVISGSAVFFGLQLGDIGESNVLGATAEINASDEQLEDAIESFFEKKQKEMEDEQAAAMEEAEKDAAEKAKNVSGLSDDDHVYGGSNAKITLIEYADFQCPYCKKFHETPKQLVDDYDGKVNWTYRHYPLGFHDPAATLQAMASECAAEIGGNDKFWDFVDVIFEENPKDINSLVSAAKGLGLSESSFKTCLESGKYKDDIKSEMEGGLKSGVQGTPGTIIYNNETGDVQLLSGAQPASAFEKVIDEMLK